MSNLRRGSWVLGVLLAALFPAAAHAAPAPFGHTCTAQADGTRFCPTTDAGPGRAGGGLPSFDCGPPDADVTFPAAVGGGWPFPKIGMLHGWGRRKKDFGSNTPHGEGFVTFPYNNRLYPEQWQAVLNFPAPGF